MRTWKSARLTSQNFLAIPNFVTRQNWGAWISAFRPKTLTASVVPIMVATVLAYKIGSLDWAVSLWALASALSIQIGTNLFNDVIDFKKGADGLDRVGPQRITQSGSVSERTVFAAAIFCFVLAILFGIPLVVKGGLPIVIVGFASLIFGYAYTGGPFPLAYRGWGDAFVLLFFGWIAVGVLTYLHVGWWSFDAFVAGTQVGMLATVLIAVNNLRDHVQDKNANKKTLVVRFGVPFGKIEIFLLLSIPFLLQCYWIYKGYWLAGALPFTVFPTALRLGNSVAQEAPGPSYNHFLVKAALVHALFGFQLTLGLALSWN